MGLFAFGKLNERGLEAIVFMSSDGLIMQESNSVFG